MKRRAYSRVDDSTYELNLAPMLDIIVSVVPMLLLSVVFVRVAMIEAPVPQVVEKAIAAANDKMKDQVSVVLSVSKTDGFHYAIVEGDKKMEKKVALKNGQLDFDGLYAQTLEIKRSYPQLFRMELSPGAEVELTEIVKTMDKVRTLGQTEKKITITDVESGKPLETDLMFPDVIFGNITGG